MRMSQPEIAALTADRVDAFKVKRQAEREAQDAEFMEWRRGQARKARTSTQVQQIAAVCLCMLGIYGFADGPKVLGFLCMFLLIGWAAHLALGYAKEPYEKALSAMKAKGAR